jgi:hypothetical protein
MRPMRKKAFEVYQGDGIWRFGAGDDNRARMAGKSRFEESLSRPWQYSHFSARLMISPAFSRVLSFWPAFTFFASRRTLPVSASIVIE